MTSSTPANKKSNGPDKVQIKTDDGKDSMNKEHKQLNQSKTNNVSAARASLKISISA